MLIWLSDFGTLSDGIHVYFSDVLLVMIDFQKKRGQWGDGGDVAENRHFLLKRIGNTDTSLHFENRLLHLLVDFRIVSETPSQEGVHPYC